MPARLSTFSVTSTGPVSMIAGSEPILAKARMRARGFSPALLPGLAVADQHGRGAIDDAGRIAGVMHVVDELDLRMRLHGDRVEAAQLAHLHERGLERASDCMVGVGPHVLVAVEDGEAVDVVDRHRPNCAKRPSSQAAAARFWLSTA